MLLLCLSFLLVLVPSLVWWWLLLVAGFGWHFWWQLMIWRVNDVICLFSIKLIYYAKDVMFQTRDQTRPRNGKNIEVMFNSAACSVHALFFLWHRWLKQSGWMIMNKLWKVFRLLVTSKAKRRVNLLWIFFTFHDFTFYSSFCCIQVAPFWCWILRVSFSLSTCVLLSSCYSHLSRYYVNFTILGFPSILRKFLE